MNGQELKEKTIEGLSSTRPLMASLLSQCDLRVEVSHPGRRITVHLKGEPYYSEQLASKACWPVLHTEMAIALRDDFTLNFEKP